MAKVTFKNGDDYLAKLSKLSLKAKADVIGPAVYSGADIVIEEVRKQLQAVPTDEKWGTQGSPANGPKKIQKKGLYDSLGIAPMRDDQGFMNVKIGFDGYNSVKTKRWPNGQPNQMVARSVEAGTSYMQKHPFVKKAVAKVRNEALDAMKETADAEIEKIMKGT